MLRMTLLGKRMRALSDDLDLAETSGIDTSRIILYTWLFAAGLAGLAGVFAGALTQLQPELGFELLLPIFAAVVLGGIGNAFGALAAGIVLGVVIEWSTFIVAPGLEARGRLPDPDHRPDHPAAGHLRPGEGGMSDPLADLPARGLVRGVHRPRVLDLGRGDRRDLRRLLDRPADERRLHRDPELRPGRVHGDRRLHDGDPAPPRRAGTSGSACRSRSPSRSASACSSGCPRCGCAPTTSRSSRSPPRRRSALVALNARDLTNGAQGIFGFDDSWDSISESIEEFIVDLGWTDVPAQFPLFLVTWGLAILLMFVFTPHPAHALGAGAASGARGRGRGPRARQERVLLQAPVAGARGDDRGAGRLPARAQPEVRRPRRVPAAGHLHRLRRPAARRASPTTGGWRSARSSCGRCSRACASSSCRSRRRRSPRFGSSSSASC